MMRRSDPWSSTDCVEEAFAESLEASGPNLNLGGGNGSDHPVGHWTPQNPALSMAGYLCIHIAGDGFGIKRIELRV